MREDRGAGFDVGEVDGLREKVADAVSDYGNPWSDEDCSDGAIAERILAIPEIAEALRHKAEYDRLRLGAKAG